MANKYNPLLEDNIQDIGSGAGGLLTASNCLTVVGTDVQLGGTATSDIVLTFNDFNYHANVIHAGSGLETHLDASNNVAGIGGEGVGFWTKNSDNYLSALFA
jgi:hypothetical protein